MDSRSITTKINKKPLNSEGSICWIKRFCRQATNRRLQIQTARFEAKVNEVVEKRFRRKITTKSKRVAINSRGNEANVSLYEGVSQQVTTATDSTNYLVQVAWSFAESCFDVFVQGLSISQVRTATCTYWTSVTFVTRVLCNGISFFSLRLTSHDKLLSCDAFHPSGRARHILLPRKS